LLAIASEALSNTIRHAGASTARLAAVSEGSPVRAWRLTLDDNGRGFDPASVTRHGHQGLANMRERAAALGGTLTIERGDAGGTRVTAWVPAPGANGAWERD
jgi:signal transduction histidine kinase